MARLRLAAAIWVVVNLLRFLWIGFRIAAVVLVVVVVIVVVVVVRGGVVWVWCLDPYY